MPGRCMWAFWWEKERKKVREREIGKECRRRVRERDTERSRERERETESDKKNRTRNKTISANRNHKGCTIHAIIEMHEPHIQIRLIHASALVPMYGNNNNSKSHVSEQQQQHKQFLTVSLILYIYAQTSSIYFTCLVRMRCLCVGRHILHVYIDEIVYIVHEYIYLRTLFPFHAI